MNAGNESTERPDSPAREAGNDPACGRVPRAGSGPGPLGPLAAAAACAAALGCGQSGPAAGPRPGPALSAGPEPVPAEGYVRLAFNESPFGPPPAALESMEEMLARPYAMESADTVFLPGINRYPDFLNVELTRVLSARHGVPAGNVVPCAGISELLYMCSQAFLGRGKDLVLPEASFPLLAFHGEARGCRVRWTPRTSGLGVDLDALLASVSAETGAVYLANPDSPSGSLLSLPELAGFVRQVNARAPDAVVVVDEAYMEYVREDPAPEAVPLAAEWPVLVGRTFSKAFGMAGLRAGYTVAHPDLALLLNGFLGGYLGGDVGWRMFEGNVNRMATAAVAGALGESGLAFLGTVREQNAALRERLASDLEGLGYAALPSHASFLLVSTGSDGENVRRYLGGRGILVQAGGSFHPGLSGRIRVSVGDEASNAALVEALRGYDRSSAYPDLFPVYYHGI